VHIPFKGGGPAMMDVIAGKHQIAIARYPERCSHQVG